MNEKENIAILLFSRSAMHESYSKHWTNDGETNFRIANHLISNTYDQLETAPFPIFRIDEKLQVGNTFGERLTNAFKYVFQKGFEHVIAVGNDCPDLRMDWHEISRQLNHHKTILGPNKRGGVYLIGLSRDSNIENKFSQIRWRSKLVFQQLKEYFQNYSVFDSRRDINTFQDIKRWNYLYKRIKVLLRKWIVTNKKASIFSVHHLSLVSLRGPPCFGIV